MELKITLLTTTNEENLNWISYWYYVSTGQLLWLYDVLLKNNSH